MNSTTHMRAGIISLLFLSSAFLGQFGQGSTSRATFQVVDAVSGLPIGNFRVAVGDRTMQAFLKTNRNGELQTKVPNQVTVCVGSYLDRDWDWELDGRLYRAGVCVVRAAPDGASNRFRIRVFPGVTATGTVLDSQGRPVRNALVLPLRLTFNENGRRVATEPEWGNDTRTTDRSGNFRATRLPAGEYIFRIRPYSIVGKPGDSRELAFYPVYLPGTTSREQARILQFGSSGSVKVGTATVGPGPVAPLYLRFIDESGTPLAGPFRVSASAVGEPNESPPADHQIDMASANILGIRLPPGLFLIGASKDGVWLGSSLVESGTTERAIDIGPQREGSVAVRIVTPTENPPSMTFRFLAESETQRDVIVDTVPTLPLFRWPSGKNPDHTKPTNIAPGIYRVIADLVAPPGVYVKGIQSEGRDLRTEDLEILPGRATNITVVLGEDAKALTGTVLNQSGVPVPDAHVALVPDDRTQVSAATSRIADVSGRFVIYAPPGQYHLYAWHRMEGAAYRNADFMSAYDSRGTSVTIDNITEQEVTLRPLDERGRF